MKRRALGAILGGALIVAVPANWAEAYFVGSPEFVARGGAAAITLQTELGPVELSYSRPASGPCG